jgi:hypothetical protein
MAQFDETNIDIAIDPAVLANAIAKNPEAIAIITKQVRDQMTKDARFMGNLFAKWASTNLPLPSSKKRVN